MKTSKIRTSLITEMDDVDVVLPTTALSVMEMHERWNATRRDSAIGEIDERAALDALTERDEAGERAWRSLTDDEVGDILRDCELLAPTHDHRPVSATDIQDDIDGEELIDPELGGESIAPGLTDDDADIIDDIILWSEADGFAWLAFAGDEENSTRELLFDALTTWCGTAKIWRKLTRSMVRAIADEIIFEVHPRRGV